MKIINLYVVDFGGLGILIETDGRLDENGYGRYFTVSQYTGFLPLNDKTALSLIKKTL